MLTTTTIKSPSRGPFKMNQLDEMKFLAFGSSRASNDARQQQRPRWHDKQIKKRKMLAHEVWNDNSKVKTQMWRAQWYASSESSMSAFIRSLTHLLSRSVTPFVRLFIVDIVSLALKTSADVHLKTFASRGEQGPHSHTCHNRELLPHPRIVVFIVGISATNVESVRRLEND